MTNTGAPWRHGITGWSEKGCKCPTCRAAHNENVRRWRATTNRPTRPKRPCTRCGRIRQVNETRNKTTAGVCRDCWYVELAA